MLGMILPVASPLLPASLEPLVHRQNEPSLSLSYRYYFGRCSFQLAELFPLPHSNGRSTNYFSSLHDFSVSIPRCFMDVLNGLIKRNFLSFAFFVMFFIYIFFFFCNFMPFSACKLYYKSSICIANFEKSLLSEFILH